MTDTAQDSCFVTPERAAKLRRVLERKQPTLTVVLENVHDPHNVSAVLRSCDAVGVVDVFLIYNGRQTFPNLGARSSASAIKWIDTHMFSCVHGCFAALRARGYAIYTTHLSSNAVSLYSLDLTQPVALVFGNEHSGISEEALKLADKNFLIPQVGIVQSLNISVACAVSLFEAFRQRQHAGMYDTVQFTPEEFDARFHDWQLR
ncbi:MAG: TrmH family RNA methyltransferase [Bacteroidota bacterium]|nr:RNA methyltransferase [Candidatus Kapabacteria bacterium]MDW8220186.1 TrmH family RNA methyltransferase [Bacteroidota bacterium]